MLDPVTNELYVDTRRSAQRSSKATLSDVERELRAQIDIVVDAGLAATHLDWHCLADGGRADIFDLAMVLAQEYGLAARVWLDDGRRKAREQGKPVVDTIERDRATALPHWLEHYNQRRPHSSIGDRPPISRVHNVCG